MPSLKSQREAVDRAQRLIENLKTHKITLHSQSRLPQYRRTLEEFTRRPEGRISYEDLRRWVCAYQEVTLLAWIFYQLGKRPQPKGWLERFKEILKGDYSASTEGDRPSPRDKQAELLFAAEARQLKFPVELEEKPDVIVSYNRGQIGVAAKRPRSQRSVKRNVKLASSQIVKRGLDGLIFLDLTLVFARDAAYWRRAKTLDDVAKLIDQLDAKIDEKISSAASGLPLPKAIFGICGYALATIFVGPTWDHQHLYRRVYRQLQPQATGFETSFFREFASRSRFQEVWQQIPGWKDPDAIYL